MPRSRRTYGFGFDPEESPYHFAVMLPPHKLASVVLEERFTWGEQHNGDTPRPSVRKAELDPDRWRAVADTARVEFNRRLRQDGQRSATWKAGETPLAPAFGKELALLFWAAEAPTTLEAIANVVANWLGLAPEERWWLYTTVNATSGHPEHGPDRGWRKAIKIALTENPANAPPPHSVALPDPERPGAPSRSGRKARMKREASAGQAQLPLMAEDES